MLGTHLIDPLTLEAMPRRREILEGLARGEQDIVAGRTTSHADAKMRMAKWLAQPFIGPIAPTTS